MDYKNLDEIFSHLSISNCTVNIYGIYQVEYGKYGCVKLKGDINAKIRSSYVSSINKYKEKKSEEFTISDSVVSKYAIGPQELIGETWNRIVKQMKLSKTLHKVPKAALMKIVLLVTEIIYDHKKYYVVSRQEKTETFYKRHLVVSVTDTCKEIDRKENIMIKNNMDCIVDINQKCFYVFRHNTVIDIFNLIEEMKKYVNKQIGEIKNWQFLADTKNIFEKKNNKGVCESLYKIFSNKQQVEGLKKLTPKQMKERCLKVAKNKLSESDFDGDKLIVTNTNRDYILKLLSGRGRYNIVLDIYEE